MKFHQRIRALSFQSQVHQQIYYQFVGKENMGDPRITKVKKMVTQKHMTGMTIVSLGWMNLIILVRGFIDFIRKHCFFFYQNGRLVMTSQ